MSENPHYRAKDQTDKMFHWLIPYLVAYNARESVDWNYGPEHIFKVEVQTNMTSENNDEMHSDVIMEISCRPKASSLVECRIESALIDNYEVSMNNSASLRVENYEDFEIGNPMFQIEFDNVGVSSITHFLTKGYFRLTMIQAIVDNFNVGIDLRDKKFGNYETLDKSVNGLCQTSFEIKELSEQDKSTPIVEYDLVSLWRLARKGPILIVKRRFMDNCVKKTPYLFGQSEENWSDEKSGFEMKYDVTSSLSKIYLGRNSFSSYTENAGVIETSFSRPSDGIEKSSKLMTGEFIRVSLEQIRPA